MFGFGKQEETAGPRVSTRLCTDRFDGRYPHVGLYDCRERKVWVCKHLNGQAIRTSHARLITGCENAVSTVWKDRFLCFWFYTPGSGEGLILGQKLDWSEAHILTRIDPLWDYDRQKLIPPEQEEHAADNLERQFKHGQRILDFFAACHLNYPVSLHFVGQRAEDSFFSFARLSPEAEKGEATRSR